MLGDRSASEGGRGAAAATAGRARGRCAAGVALLGLSLAAQPGALDLAEAIPESVAGGVPFLENFLQPHYLVPVGRLEPITFPGVLHARYDQVPIPVRPGLELLLVGEFPRARFFSITVYDDHGAIVDVIDDRDLVPLIPGSVNPFVPGGPSGAEDVLYAVTVRLGQTLASTPDPPCGFGTLDVHANLLEARFRHTAGDRYSCQQSGFAVENVPFFGTVTHDDGRDSRAAVVMLRRYLPQPPAPGSRLDLRVPLVFVRDSRSGCPLALTEPGRRLTPGEWFRSRHATDTAQALAHIFHERDLGFSAPFGLDPANHVGWLASGEFVLHAMPEGYVAANVPFDRERYADASTWLNAAGRVMLLHVRLPQVPCAQHPDCPLTGEEQLRYWGLNLVDTDSRTIVSLSDRDLVVSPAGDVSLVVTFGTPIPPAVNAASGYTVVALPAASRLAQLHLRTILPRQDFPCAADAVPFRTAEHHPYGGYMAEYAPLVRFPRPAALPVPAVPVPDGGDCRAVPRPDPCPPVAAPPRGQR